MSMHALIGNQEELSIKKIIWILTMNLKWPFGSEGKLRFQKSLYM
jgi:hypothetical protein